MFNKTFDTPVIRSIAIVGSGLSGLTAAIQLKELGHDVTVFEKSRGPGGRLASKRVSDGSVDVGAQYFTSRNPQFLPFLRQFGGDSIFAPWHGRFGFQTSTGQWEAFPQENRFVGTPRMTAITRALSAHTHVVTETRVGSLVRNDQSWTVYDTAGNPLGDFDQIIITTPPAQARDLLADSGLDRLASYLDDPVSRVLPCWAVAAHFPVSPWLHHEGMRCQHPALFWVANNSSKPDRPDDGQWWVLHAGPSWTEEHVDTPAEEVANRLLEAFRQLTGFQVGPDDIVTHRWLYARSEGGEQPGHLWFPDCGLGFAGDWLSGGRVEGAFDSASGLVAELTASAVTR
ncbi:NAD(P)/FAD-dependent oxidoreductase [Marinobacter sp. F3R08]|uniref:NAD(P)/FAD-dependent oxidoreductase n=1 Tax=Marinobacter sp. F3R08 TaxID=2841559 RepID=UPI001C07F7F6|nr:FAD-dependent oxidoreductase [Marinobacter sp. F3R08]MBU2955743.1 FAD-dependent oxidoreductase [Marinobacter sp. F3R08]